MTRRKAIVLNQFAMPRTHWGITRNAVLFSRLPEWETVIFAGARDHYGQQSIVTDDPLFVLTRIPAYGDSGRRRIMTWILFALKSFFFVLTRRRASLVFASSPHLLAPVAGLAAARLRRVPFVMEIRDLHPESLVAGGAVRRGGRLHSLLVRVERTLYRQADAIVVVTEGWERHLEEHGADLARVFVVPNGVDVEAMQSAESKKVLRNRLGLEDNRLWFVYAGAHGLANGLDQLLDAAAKEPEIGFLLIGAGNQKEALIERAQLEGLTNVRFLEPVSKEALADVLGACDVGVHVLAPWELLQRGLSPNKVYDYMAAGLPTVSNCAQGLKAIASDGECGRWGGMDDLHSMIRAVAEATPQQRTEWGRRGSEIVLTRFSRQSAAELLSAALECAVTNRRRK